MTGASYNIKSKYFVCFEELHNKINKKKVHLSAISLSHFWPLSELSDWMHYGDYVELIGTVFFLFGVYSTIWRYCRLKQTPLWAFRMPNMRLLFFFAYGLFSVKSDQLQRDGSHQDLYRCQNHLTLKLDGLSDGYVLSI